MTQAPVSHNAIAIGIVGDFSADFAPHVATSAALEHAAAALGISIDSRWIATDSICDLPESELARFDGWMIAPGSPYESMEGALRVIRFARERKIPLFGACGGLQHMIIEFARHVMGYADATHAEYDPNGSTLFITPLSCSLAGKKMQVSISPRSRAAAAYWRLQSTERYYCNFGLNPAWQEQLHAAGLRVMGTDADGEARILEIPEHRFFLGTLFVPQMLSKPGAPHPLIVAFLQAAAR
ncbi:MAG TPA: hypothetical protein VGJ26_03785 [Pirellulales bacterium]|jgi:CTP synthase (UTP-ammonia lyase)